GAADQLLNVRRVDVGDYRLDGDLGVDAAQLLGRGDSFWQIAREVVLVEEHLALEVAELEVVAVDDAEVPHAGADEHVGEHGAEGAAAHEQRARGAQAGLAGLANAGEEYLPGVALQVIPRRRRGRWRPRRRSGAAFRGPAGSARPRR